MREIHSILKQYWGYDAFRPLQEDIINSVLAGNDCLALMPTGGGKSLCYQVPGMAMDGLCLVVSPLIALMKDQVETLRRKGITAFAVYSGMSRKEVINTFKVAGESNCKFLYVSPERVESALFKEYLPSFGVCLVAVDEAHCISQWGYDFRPPYLRIAALRDELPEVPLLALTASATPEVQEDICHKLAFKTSRIFRQSFERANLSYSVFNVDSKINKIIEILKNVKGSSIIYCKSRKRTKAISDLLQLQQITSDYYHAGLASEDRNNKQEAWINNKIRVMVCTNAFGMGIDKPDVRTVIHADVPDCLENYYQEAGRAGRDGKKAYAILLYDNRDIPEFEKLAALRFPVLADIRNIYQSIANYLQIPTGAGQGQYYDFDLADFIKKFRHTGHNTLYTLKALEQEGWLTFNEQVFMPSEVGFTTDKNQLYAFEKEYPELDGLLKTLLRAYEGIFDQPVAVSEKMIAGLMKLDTDIIKRDLMRLHQAGIISYQPQKDTPQLFLARNRIKAEDITIDMAAYNKRKEQFQKRMKQMMFYINEITICRSQVIGSYFGDEKIKACGICDNCLRQKNIQLSKEEFDMLHERVIAIIKNNPVQVKDLLSKLNGIKKEKAWKVIEFLQSENKISVDKAGLVSLH